MRGLWRVLGMLVVASCMFATGTTVAAGSGSSAPSLAGEVMLAGADTGGGGMFEVTLRCGATSPSWWTYSASGVATGPYPGTFTETGTVYIDAPGTGTTGPVLSLHADFTIASGSTVVTGTKDMQVSASNTGSCLAGSDQYDALFVSAATYSATIDTASGSFQDAGSATLNTERSDHFLLSPSGSVSLGGVSRFQESFDTSSGTTPTPTPKNVVVGAGLTGPLMSPILFGFYAKQDTTGMHGICGVFDPVHRSFVRCLNVDSYVVSGSHVTFTGDATINKVATRYQIDVVDNGEPGYRDTFKITTTSGYTASSAGFLLGDIRIHH